MDNGKVLSRAPCPPESRDVPIQIAGKTRPYSLSKVKQQQNRKESKRTSQMGQTDLANFLQFSAKKSAPPKCCKFQEKSKIKKNLQKKKTANLAPFVLFSLSLVIPPDKRRLAQSFCLGHPRIGVRDNPESGFSPPSGQNIQDHGKLSQFYRNFPPACGRISQFSPDLRQFH